MDPTAAVLAAEQTYLDAARAALAAMQARAEQNLAFGERSAREERTVDAQITRWHLARRLEALEVGGAALCFGRIDDGDGDRERHYIGRRHIEDGAGDPLVVDWRAPVAVPFYRATAADPLGLVLRRRFTMEGPNVVAIFDEDLDDPDAPTGSGIPDPVLAQIERRRTGAMADIVATIAAEQDVIIRAPLDELLLIQGGPGTGKTAVALHRAAFLLFDHRERLTADKILVLGPNKLFLRYIAQVLPSLGETAVREATIESLYEATYPVRATDSPAAAALKGDARMAELLTRLARARLSVPTADERLPVGTRVVTLSPDAVGSAQDTALARNLAMNEARSVYRELLVRAAWMQLAARGVDPGEEPLVVSDLRRRPELKRLVDRTWPALSAPALVRSLLANRALRGRIGAGLLTADEHELLQRRPGSKAAAPKTTSDAWTAADIPLLDEATALVAGVAVRYGHVVVDEAQDLSAMALRMAGRRARNGSMTVLGDLAQATAPGAMASWERAAATLVEASGASSSARRADLTVGYRVPGPILELANRLLPEAAPDVPPPTSIRERGEPPLVVATNDLATGVADEVEALTEQWGTIGIVAVPELIDRLRAALAARGVAAVVPDAGGRGLGEPVVLIAPSMAKGLEFDAVIVVEPAAIAELDGGLRLLYIALTRAVQHLGIVHSRPLPSALEP